MILFRKAVLIIHGFTGNLYDNEYLMNYLELDPNYDVYARTLPGHNHDRFNNAKMDDCLQFVDNQSKELINNGYNTIYVIGHSVAEVDLPYFRYVENCTHQADWTVYYFNVDEKDRIYKKLMDCGIQKSRIHMKEAMEFYNL